MGLGYDIGGRRGAKGGGKLGRGRMGGGRGEYKRNGARKG